MKLVIAITGASGVQVGKNFVEYQIKDLNTNQLNPSSLHSLLELYKTIPIAFEVNYVYLRDNKRILSRNLTKVESYITFFITVIIQLLRIYFL